MECGSVGVLRQVGIAPRDREVGDAGGAEDIRSLLRSTTRKLLTTLCRPFGAGPSWIRNLGLKPQPESCSPFGTEITSHLSLLT